MGVGNIAGMAAALFTGGPGSIFWLWVLALVGSSVALIEAILAQTFRVKVFWRISRRSCLLYVAGNEK